MRRLRLLILVFFVALTVPLAYLVVQTHRSLEQEEIAELRYFANTLFDKMEQEMAALVVKEEGRAIDEYNYHRVPPAQDAGGRGAERSPLSRLPQEPYILGYLQNNPDGSFQTPFVDPGQEVDSDLASVVAQLEEVNRAFNSKRTAVPESPEIRPSGMVVLKKENGREKDTSSVFAEKYLDLSRGAKQRAQLGQEEKRIEQVSPAQAQNLAQRDLRKAPAETEQLARVDKDQIPASVPSGPRRSLGGNAAVSPPPSPASTLEEGQSTGALVESQSTAAAGKVQPPAAPSLEARRYQAELDPMQSVQIDGSRVFVFRRIVIDNQVYRQGVVIRVREFLTHLIDAHFLGQPMARFTSLTLTALDHGREIARIQSGASVVRPSFSLERGFPRPFSVVRATLTCEQIPRSAGRGTLNLMVGVLAAVVLIGLLAIYQSARVVMDLSERRSRFVSSVTHELKTPLTNIRMYIEMLEQGIAVDPERELEYYRILGSESGRLSRLINNVLEFSKLERKQRRLDLREGTLEEVIQEIRDVMEERLRQEGFVLKVEREEVAPFRYDREVMVQVLTNLIENSVKFGKGSPVREITIRVRSEGRWVNVSVSDTGPGIPRQALKKVFDDFYRVDSPLTRATKGTGIGLALVKRFVAAMGGAISATNNRGPGCTITLSLPA